MAIEIITGDDGKLVRVASSPIITGTLVDETKYIVTVIGGSSTLPAGVEVGTLFTADGTEDITASDDEVLEVTESDQCDIQSWALDFSAAEIDATTLCDKQNVYLTGKTDITGTMEGIFKLGITDADGGAANGFVAITTQAGNGGAITVNPIDKSNWIVLLYMQDSKAVGETETCYVAEIVRTSFSSGITGGETSSFSTSFRIAPFNQVAFQLYQNTHVA